MRKHLPFVLAALCLISCGLILAFLPGCMTFSRATDSTDKNGVHKHSQTSATAISGSGFQSILDGAKEVASDVSNFLPEPWGSLLKLGIGGGAIGLLNRRQRQQTDAAYDEAHAKGVLVGLATTQSPPPSGAA